MKRFLILLSLVVAVSSCLTGCYCKGAGNAAEIVIENEQFRLVLGSDAVARSLVLKSTGEECLMKGENMPLFSVTQERPYHNELKLAHPNKKTTFEADTVYRDGDRLIVGFELVPWDAVIGIKQTPSYIGFTLEGFIVEPGDYPEYLKITPPPATELRLLQLPVRKMTNFGEWLNVSWDDGVAVNVLATDPYAYIDFEDRNGYRVLTATALKDQKFEGTGAALIVSTPECLLDNIAALEEDFDLPKGADSRRSDLINAAYYWTYEINPGNVDEHIKYAKMGGFRLMNIYYPAFEGNISYGYIGNYEIDRRFYPNGKEDLKKMLDRIKAAGIIPGVHFLHSHIGLKSMYVTPVPDYRLNIVKSFNLSQDLSADDNTLYVEQNPAGCTMADGCRVLRAGTELIGYESFTTTPPYMFKGCVRGIHRTTVNALPRGHEAGLLDVSEFGASSVYVDQRTSLQDEVAGKIADIYDAGFQFIYFDGSEGVNPPFGINVALAQYRVFKKLNPQPIFAEGAAKSHFSWHMLSGGNAFDIFPPETIKEEVRKWPAEEAPRMMQDFTRINFGWMGYYVPNEATIGTQPDMWEFVTGVAAAWNSPVSVWGFLGSFGAHPRTADNLEVIRRWEDVRARHWLTDKHKTMLKNVEREHHLLIDEKGEFELVPYEQITDIAGGSKEVRAFFFKRGGKDWIVYWHTSGNRRLELALEPSDIALYKTIGEAEVVSPGGNGGIVIPASDRRYIEAKNLNKKQLLDALKNARIVD